MKTLNSFRNIIMLLALIGIASCTKKDVPGFLKRNTDMLNFTYLNSTKDLAILSNGNWKVSSNNDWISLSPSEGTGDGKTEQNIQVTVQQNTNDVRTGSITLFNEESTLSIEIEQDAGHLSMSKPTMASSFIIDEELTEETIQIPYNKGADGDLVNITAILQGPGSVGLSVENLIDYSLAAGDGWIPLKISGTPTAIGEIQVDIHVEVALRSYSSDLTVKSRTKLESGGLDPLESPTVTLFKALPRLAVLDWGTYEKGSGVSRKFILELSRSQYGPSIRRYFNQTDWLSSTSAGTGMFFDHNRFVFGDLEPNTTYWFRIVHRSLDLTKNLDSDMTYFEFSTPADEIQAPNVVLYKDFDNFWWGGNPIYQAFGVQPTEAQILVPVDPASDAIKANDYRTIHPVSNLASVFSGNLAPNKTVPMWNYNWDGAKYGTNVTGSGYAGWYGVNALPNTGSLRLGTASAQGSIQTPTLEGIGAGTADITVIVNSAAYFEPYHSWGEDYLSHYIIVSGGGKITDGGPTMTKLDSDEQVTVTCKSNVNSANNGSSGLYTAPTKHTIKISGATKDTRITVKSYPYSGANHYRIWVDDIKITKD